MKDPIPDIDQIQSILHLSALFVVSRHLGRPITRSDFDGVITVTRRQIQEFVAQNGLPQSVFYSSYEAPKSPGEMTGDGFYLIEEKDRFIFYYQERGCKFNPQVFSNWEEARESITDALINAALLGFEMKPA